MLKNILLAYTLLFPLHLFASVSGSVVQTHGFSYHKTNAENAQFEMLAPNNRFRSQDTIRTTKRALVLLEIPQGHRLKVGPESTVLFDQLPTQSSQSVELSIENGQLYTYTITEPSRLEDYHGYKIQLGPHLLSLTHGKAFIAVAGEAGQQEALLISFDATGEVKNSKGETRSFVGQQGLVITPKSIAPLARNFHEELMEKLNWEFDGSLDITNHLIEL